MSGYDKNQETYDVYGYDPSTRPAQEQSYGVYAPSLYNPHTPITATSQAPEAHAVPHANQMPFLSATYVPRDPGYHPPAPPLLPARPFPAFELTSTGPYHGFVNDTFQITFKSRFEYHPLKHLFLIDFGGKAQVKARLYKDFTQELFHHFSLQITVPDLQGEHQAMPLLIELQDENALFLEQKSAGDFFYTSGGYNPYSSGSRKRKLIEQPSDFSRPSAKRSASQPLRPAKFKDSSTGFSVEPVPVQSASPFPSPLFVVPQDRPSSQAARYGPLSGQQRPMYGYGMSPNMTAQPIKVESPLLTSYGGSYQSLKPPGSPQIGGSTMSGVPMRRTVTASVAPTPTWVRTTSQPSGSRASEYSGIPHFNPYAQYPETKAKLELVGDLATMCEDWTQAERSAGRRLVEFTRSQEGSTIMASFRAVSPEQLTAGNPCVSCIYWASKKSYYVTSVDTIALLEGLVGVRFTVEEKNRIRRNLEGFKPFTVAKSKNDCDDIFRLIMGFPAPKPRNIEKDIKIFPWVILIQALKKIIGKYSASYASTSGLLGTSTSAAGLGATLTETSDVKRITASPTSSTGTTTGGQYGASMTSTALSPIMGGGSAGLGLISSPHDLRATTSMPHLFGQAGQWSSSGEGATGFHGPAYTTAMATSAPTRSWGLQEMYLEQAARAGASSGADEAQTSGYYRTSDDGLLQQSTRPGSAQYHAESSRYMPRTSHP